LRWIARRKRNLLSVRHLTAAAPAADPKEWKNESKEQLPPPNFSSSPRVPFRHSRNKLPAVCTDPVQLLELTQELMEAGEGTLYTYESGKDSMEEAWVAADATVQKAEFVVRGHAWLLPGTQWNRWISAESQQEVDPTPIMESMQALIDRLWEEGYTYMTLRAARLEELHGPKAPKSGEGDLTSDEELLQDDFQDLLEAGGEEDEEDEVDYETTEVFETVQDLQADIEKFAREEGLTAEGSDDIKVLGEGDLEVVGGGSAEEDYMEDFALPGPTVNIYNALLDVMACHPESDFVTPMEASLLLEFILMRHKLDGGDEKNTNSHTRPSVMTFNAPIRIASTLPFDHDDKQTANVRYRDEAITLAFAAFDTLSHSGVSERNSATYNYLLSTVAKYFPSSRIRGNIAHGMFHHARLQGLIDSSVIRAHIAANEPSNGKEFDDWIEETLKEKAVKDLPHKWRRNSRRRRYHPRENDY